jgi:hypothetical protein
LTHSDVNIVGYNKETVFHLVSRVNELDWLPKEQSSNVRTIKNISLHMNDISLNTIQAPTICGLLGVADRSNIKALSAADNEGRTPVCLRGYNTIPQNSIIMFPLLSAASSCRHER